MRENIDKLNGIKAHFSGLLHTVQLGHSASLQKTGKAVGADGCFHFFSSPLSTTSCPVAADS